jgi:hypothetical protein
MGDKFLLAVGSLIDGYNFIGPFDTYSDAVYFVEDSDGAIEDGYWTVFALKPPSPNPYLANGDETPHT